MGLKEAFFPIKIWNAGDLVFWQIRKWNLGFRSGLFFLVPFSYVLAAHCCSGAITEIEKPFCSRWT